MISAFVIGTKPENKQVNQEIHSLKMFSMIFKNLFI